MLLKEFFPLMRKLDEKLIVIFCFICKRTLKKTRTPKEFDEYWMDETRTKDQFGCPEKEHIGLVPTST